MTKHDEKNQLVFCRHLKDGIRTITILYFFLITPSLAFSLNKVIYVSPSKAYFIAGEGEDNGYTKGQDVCFDDPTYGRITCAKVFVSTKTASGFVILSKFMSKISLRTVVSPLRWRTKEKNYSTSATENDIASIKSSLEYLEKKDVQIIEESSTQKLNNSNSNRLRNERASSSRNPPSISNLNSRSTKSPLASRRNDRSSAKTIVRSRNTPQSLGYQRLNTNKSNTRVKKETEKESEEIRPSNQRSDQKANDKQAKPSKKIRPPKKPNTKVKTVVKTKIKIVPKTKIKKVFLTEFLGRPTSIEAGYILSLKQPIKNQRIEFITQSESSTNYWSNAVELNTLIPGFKLRLRQYLSNGWHYGINVHIYSVMTDSAQYLYDKRRPDLISEVSSKSNANSYGAEYGLTIPIAKYFDVDYAGGLAIYSNKISYNAKYYSSQNLTKENLLVSGVEHDVLYFSNEFRAKVLYKKYALSLNIGVDLSLVDLSGKPNSEAFDPNLNSGDQSSASSTQFDELIEDPVNLFSYYVGIGLQAKF